MTVPFVRSMLLCEDILVDEMSGSWSLIRVFNHTAARGFPTIMPRLCVYSSVFDLEGYVSGKFQLMDPELKFIDARPTPGTWATRDREINFGATFLGLVIPKPGRYSVEFLVGDRVLQTARLDVRLFSEAQAPQ